MVPMHGFINEISKHHGLMDACREVFSRDVKKNRMV
jgi:hypothetical protein